MNESKMDDVPAAGFLNPLNAVFSKGLPGNPLNHCIYGCYKVTGD